MMRINRHSFFSTITSWLLCTLFIVQIANRTVYFHSHKVTDGNVISHAHPYNKSSDSAPYKKHHHTNSQFALLAQPDVLFFVAILLFALYNISKKQVCVKRDVHRYLTGFISRKPGRSPPVFS